MTHDNFTTFIGLQSLGQPYNDTNLASMQGQEDALLNASMLYAHGVSFSVFPLFLYFL